MYIIPIANNDLTRESGIWPARFVGARSGWWSAGHHGVIIPNDPAHQSYYSDVTLDTMLSKSAVLYGPRDILLLPAKPT